MTHLTSRLVAQQQGSQPRPAVDQREPQAGVFGPVAGLLELVAQPPTLVAQVAYVVQHPRRQLHRHLGDLGVRDRLGGRALTELSLGAVRGSVGLVDDDPHVFATTLAENVRLARPGATDDEVDAALRAARLGPWVDSLPAALGSWLGDGHAEVSGGERARIAIARSLLADQPVLVLDEPAAHLDGATADALAEEVLGRADGRSVVWITHAEAGLDRVDRVVDLGAPLGRRQSATAENGAAAP